MANNLKTFVLMAGLMGLFLLLGMTGVAFLSARVMAGARSETGGNTLRPGKVIGPGGADAFTVAPCCRGPAG